MLKHDDHFEHMLQSYSYVTRQTKKCYRKTMILGNSKNAYFQHAKSGKKMKYLRNGYYVAICLYNHGQILMAKRQKTALSLTPQAM